LKDTDLASLTDGAKIIIKGYAIQADDLGGKTAPADVWNVLQTQNQ